jgi:hypothetical protein
MVLLGGVEGLPEALPEDDLTSDVAFTGDLELTSGLAAGPPDGSALAKPGFLGRPWFMIASSLL